MKKLLIVLAAVMLTASTNVFSQVNPRSTYVDGYTRDNGTYVEGHYRTLPNNTMNDNFSTYPNVNPYTGKQGTIRPERPQQTTPLFQNQNNSVPNRRIRY